MFAELLDVEEVIAQVLVTEGYVTIDSVANENSSNLEKIEGFDKDLSNEIIIRAKNYLSLKDQENIKIINEKQVDEDLKSLKGIDNKMLALLATNNILTLDDFAGLATFDLLDKEEGIFRELELDEATINSMIMKAREKWFTEKKET